MLKFYFKFKNSVFSVLIILIQSKCIKLHVKSTEFIKLKQFNNLFFNNGGL